MRKRTLLGTLVLAGMTAIAAGQTTGTSSEKADDLLAGPKVTEAPGAPQRDRAMGAAAGKLPEIAPRRWFQLARRLDLTIDQEREVVRVLRELMTAREAYQKKHGPKLRQLRARMKASREAGQQPPPEVREQMTTLLAAAPSAAAYQKQVWEILTPDQRAEMQASIDNIIEERRQRRAAAGDQRAAPGDKRPGSTDRDTGAFDERAKRRQRFLESRRRGGQRTDESTEADETGKRGDRTSSRSRD